MPQQPLPQRQLFNVRQIVVALGVLACFAFVVSYSSRILVGIRTETEFGTTQQGVAAQESRKQELDGLLATVDDPAAVEEFARNQMNWTRDGDQVLTPIEKPAVVAEPVPAEEGALESVAPESNLRAWWQLIAPEASIP